MAARRMFTWRCCFVVLLGWVPEVGARTEHRIRKNPTRKIVSLLQEMMVELEKQEEQEMIMHDKFMCACDTSKAELGKSTTDAETKIPDVQSLIEEISSSMTRLKYDLKLHKKDRSATQKALTEGKAIREKERAAFTKESAENKANIVALGKAIPLVEKGMAGDAFLQTEATAFRRLRRIAVDGQIGDTQRDLLVAFLSEGNGGGAGYTPSYQPKSGEVLGMLKELKEGMEKSLAEADAQESKANQDFLAMEDASSKEIAALKRAIEDKEQRIGDLAVRLAELMQDMKDTKASLATNSDLLADLLKECSARSKEWEVRQKTRAEEKLAIADTIKILNDDGARELFEKTMPAQKPLFFLQVRGTADDVRAEAVRILRRAHEDGAGGSLQLDLLALAIRGKKVGFEKVLKMIDDTVALLRREQDTDDQHKTYCEATLPETKQNLNMAARAVEDRQKAIDKQSTAAEVISGEIDVLIQGIRDLDEQVVEATKQRKGEHAEFSAKRTEQTTAKELLELAKKRLTQFYGDGKGKNRVGLLQMSGGRPSEQAFSLLQLQSWEEYRKQKGAAQGVVGMIEWLIADVSQQISEMTKEESEAQQDYERFMADCDEKRRADGKRIAKKEGVKAGLEEELVELGLKKASEVELRDATAKFMAKLHDECDWSLANYQKRKVARSGEIEALQKAKALLSGDSYDWMKKKRPGELEADMEAKAAASGETYISRGEATSDGTWSAREDST